MKATVKRGGGVRGVEVCGALYVRLPGKAARYRPATAAEAADVHCVLYVRLTRGGRGYREFTCHAMWVTPDTTPLPLDPATLPAPMPPVHGAVGYCDTCTTGGPAGPCLLPGCDGVVAGPATHCPTCLGARWLDVTLPASGLVYSKPCPACAVGADGGPGTPGERAAAYAAMGLPYPGQ